VKYKVVNLADSSAIEMGKPTKRVHRFNVAAGKHRRQCRRDVYRNDGSIWRVSIAAEYDDTNTVQRMSHKRI
jgi:hypothetical protein